MDPSLQAEVGAALGSTVTRARPVSGGDINRAHAVTLADGREVFVKSNAAAPSGMFEAEARGLAWLRAGAAVRLPGVLEAHPGFLILELVRSGTPLRGFDEELGRVLAALHRASPAKFGLDHDNFVGRLPQSNRPAPRWSEFYARERLEPQLRRATDAGLVSPRLRDGLARLLADIDHRVGPDEPPARLHGDLWSGNLMCDEAGAPCLVDPAAYGGHREVDLAMMRLFGGFGPRTFAAYHEAFPLADGHEERVALYQIYPLLVHANLFGASYIAPVASALASLT